MTGRAATMDTSCNWPDEPPDRGILPGAGVRLGVVLGREPTYVSDRLYARLAGAVISNAPLLFVKDEPTVSPVRLSVSVRVAKPIGLLLVESITMPLIVMLGGIRINGVCPERR